MDDQNLRNWEGNEWISCCSITHLPRLRRGWWPIDRSSSWYHFSLFARIKPLIYRVANGFLGLTTRCFLSIKIPSIRFYVEHVVVSVSTIYGTYIPSPPSPPKHWTRSYTLFQIISRLYPKIWEERNNSSKFYSVNSYGTLQRIDVNLLQSFQHFFFLIHQEEMNDPMTYTMYSIDICRNLPCLAAIEINYN